MTWARGGLTALAVGHVAACQAPTEVTLAISTNVDCAKLQGTAIVVGKDGKDTDGRDPATITQACLRGRIGDIVLLPGQSREGSFAVKIVAAVGDGVRPEDCLAGTVTGAQQGERGCIVARRELSFIPHQPLDLPIALHRACIGVPCNADQTCVEDGHCETAHVGDPALCAGPGGCNEASLGTGGSGAGTASSGTTSQSTGTMTLSTDTTSQSTGTMTLSTGTMTLSTGTMSLSTDTMSLSTDTTSLSTMSLSTSTMPQSTATSGTGSSTTATASSSGGTGGASGSTTSGSSSASMGTGGASGSSTSSSSTFATTGTSVTSVTQSGT
jgi:hypothetical protein